MDKVNYEVTEDLGEITIRDPESGIVIKFMRNEPNTFSANCEKSISGEKYTELSRKMVDYAYEYGFFTGNGYAQMLKRQARRKVLGEQLRKAREESGLSVYEVNQRTGINRGVIQRTEAGRANTTIDTVLELCAVYGREVIVR